MTQQSSKGISLDRETRARQGQGHVEDMDPHMHQLVVGRARDLNLTIPPAPDLGLSSDASASSSSSSTGSPRHAPSGSPPTAPPREHGSELEHGPDKTAGARPPSVASSCTSSTSGERNRSRSTSGGSPLNQEEWQRNGRGSSQEGAMIVTHAYAHKQDMREAADQAAVTSAQMEYPELAASAEMAASPSEPAAGGSEERNPPGIDAGVALTRRSLTPCHFKDRRGFTSDENLNLDHLPNETLMHIMSYLEVCDLLATSRTNHHLRSLSLQPILHHYRLQRARFSLPYLLISPSRPTLAELIARHIFLTHTTQISRRLARSLVAIRLSRRLPLRPTAQSLVQRGVLPGECVEGYVAPGLVAKKRAVERERLKDSLRRWVGGVWKGEVVERGEGIRKWDESRGVGRVWKLRRFWERVSRDGSSIRD